MGEHKKEIFRLLAAANTLAVALAVTSLWQMPWWICVLIFAVPYLIAGGEVLLETLENIRGHKWFDEAFLMTVATLGAFAIGEYPEAVFVMLLFGIGELFEDISTDKSRDSVAKLMELRPDSATLETPNGETPVLPEAVKVGDIIIVKPGERIPLDGVVLSGESALDTAALTGESLPRTVTPGDFVAGGCVNLNGVLRVQVSGIYAESTAAKILELVEHAADQKSRPERFITKFSHYYTPAVVVLAVLLATVGGLVSGNFAEWIRRALMCLVASCPCALVVSIPLSYFCGIGGASQKGILIKGAAALESLSQTRTVAFDKTGTLTHGSFTVTAIHPQTVSPNALLEIAALAESESNHPIAQSVLAAWHQPIDKTRIGEICEIAGKGILAEIDGRRVALGNAALIEQTGVTFRNCPHDGTVLHLAVDGIYMGHIAIADTLKPTAAATVESLKADGIKTVLLTGDRRPAAKTLAETVGVDEYYAELLPADKVDRLEKLLSPDGTTVFVGDGINDAPVLTRADLGVAMGALGSDAALRAADIVLMDDDPAKLIPALHIARKTTGIVRQNLVLTLAVKFGVLALASIGVVNLWLAIGADVGVLMLAILNAMRCRKS